jgi:hypothetical protein
MIKRCWFGMPSCLLHFTQCGKNIQGQQQQGQQHGQQHEGQQQQGQHEEGQQQQGKQHPSISFCARNP